MSRSRTSSRIARARTRAAVPAPERLATPEAAVATAEAPSNTSMQAAIAQPGTASGGALQSLAAGAGNRAVQRMIAAQRLSEADLDGAEPPSLFNMPDVSLPPAGGGPLEVRRELESAGRETA